MFRRYDDALKAVEEFNGQQKSFEWGCFCVPFFVLCVSADRELNGRVLQVQIAGVCACAGACMCAIASAGLVCVSCQVGLPRRWLRALRCLCALLQLNTCVLTPQRPSALLAFK